MVSADQGQAVVRILFAKLANELGLKYKIPKKIKPRNFDVFFKNLRFKTINIGRDPSGRYFVEIDTMIDFRKTVREIIDDYGSSLSLLSYDYSLIHVADRGHFVEISLPNRNVVLSIYDRDVNQLGQFNRNSYNREDGEYGIKGIFSENGSLYIRKSLIDDIYIYCRSADCVRRDLLVLLDGKTFEYIARSGH